MKNTKLGINKLLAMKTDMNKYSLNKTKPVYQIRELVLGTNVVLIIQSYLMIVMLRIV